MSQTCGDVIPVMFYGANIDNGKVYRDENIFSEEKNKSAASTSLIHNIFIRPTGDKIRSCDKIGDEEGHEVSLCDGKGDKIHEDKGDKNGDEGHQVSLCEEKGDKNVMVIVMKMVLKPVHVMIKVAKWKKTFQLNHQKRNCHLLIKPLWKVTVWLVKETMAGDQTNVSVKNEKFRETETLVEKGK